MQMAKLRFARFAQRPYGKTTLQTTLKEKQMQRDVLWTQWDGHGLEHLRLRGDPADAPAGAIADGLIIGVDDNQSRSAWRIGLSVIRIGR